MHMKLHISKLMHMKLHLKYKDTYSDGWLHVLVAFVVSIFVIRVVVLPAHCSIEHLHCEHIIAFIFEVYEAAEIHTVGDGKLSQPLARYIRPCPSNTTSTVQRRGPQSAAR